MRLARGRVGNQRMSLAEIFGALVRTRGVLHPIEEVRVSLGNRVGHVDAVGWILVKNDRRRSLLVDSDVQDHFAVIAARSLQRSGVDAAQFLLETILDRPFRRRQAVPGRGANDPANFRCRGFPGAVDLNETNRGNLGKTENGQKKGNEPHEAWTRAARRLCTDQACFSARSPTIGSLNISLL